MLLWLSVLGYVFSLFSQLFSYLFPLFSPFLKFFTISYFFSTFLLSISHVSQLYYSFLSIFSQFSFNVFSHFPQILLIFPSILIFFSFSQLAHDPFPQKTKRISIHRKILPSCRLVLHHRIDDYPIRCRGSLGSTRRCYRMLDEQPLRRRYPMGLSLWPNERRHYYFGVFVTDSALIIRRVSKQADRLSSANKKNSRREEKMMYLRFIGFISLLFIVLVILLAYKISSQINESKVREGIQEE